MTHHPFLRRMLQEHLRGARGCHPHFSPSRSPQSKGESPESWKAGCMWHSEGPPGKGHCSPSPGCRLGPCHLHLVSSTSWSGRWLLSEEALPDALPVGMKVREAGCHPMRALGTWAGPQLLLRAGSWGVSAGWCLSSIFSAHRPEQAIT